MKLALPVVLSLLMMVPSVHAEEPAKPDKPKTVCRSQVPTGRRIAMRTCLPAERWAQIDEENAVAGRGFTDRTSQHAGVSGPSVNPMTGLPGQ